VTPAERRAWIVAQARALGFDLCGIAPAADFPELARLPEWLARGYAGEMHYLHDPRRHSPQAAMPGARSLIVCALNYNTPFPYSTSASSAPSAVESSARRGWISRYAWGDDYHDVLGAKLDALLAALRAQFAATPFDARAYVDTGPVHERIAAHHAGLGWLGKNTCLINPHLGSWLFLGVILTTLDLAPSLATDAAVPRRPVAESSDHPIPIPSPSPLTPSPYPLPPDLCGQCTQCLDACPTGALVEPYVLDARRCISYLTIELRGPIPAEFEPALGWHLFGCDICQDVCPFNRRAPATAAPEFQPRNARALLAASHGEDLNSKTENPAEATPSADWSLFQPPLEPLASLSEFEFRTLFRGSAVKRAKHAGLTRNAALALKNSREG
jgi:epoxyqueuosine reductase